VAASGEILIGSSTANQNAIRITDSATTLKNVSFLGGLLLGNNGTIGSSTLSPNAIIVTDTSGTIFQNRGDSSGTISIGNPSIGALQLTSSGSTTTIRPTVASAGRLSIGSSTANPNMIVISDTSGTILQNRGDLSGTLFVGNPSRGLQITGGDISGVAIPTGFATMRPSVSVSGCLVLGSSTRNPDAITITDTTTSIKNLSFSGGLLLGNGGSIGSSPSNSRAIVVTDTSGTIIQNADLSGTVYIGYGNRTTALKITGGDISGGGSIRSLATLQPNVSISGELILGSSTANQNAIIITDTATTITNLSSSPSYSRLRYSGIVPSSNDVNMLPGQTTLDYDYTSFSRTFNIYPQTTGRYIILSFCSNTPFGTCTLNIYPQPPYAPGLTGVVLESAQTFTFDIILGIKSDYTTGLVLINGLGGNYTLPTPAYTIPRYY